MNKDALVEKLLKNSNFYSIPDDQANDFVKAYIKKLVEDIVLYVDSNFTIENIEFKDAYDVQNELSQEITGVPSAYSALDGDVRALTAFAESYSHLGIADYDSLCKEALLDFLNLHNGLFVVYLSENKIYELSLSVPKQNGEKSITGTSSGNVMIIPIKFTYGLVNFILAEFPA